MSSRLPLLALLGLLAATLIGFGLLFRLRLNQGDSFPANSSLRSDPLGTRALHDGLAMLPALQVTRSFEPLAQLSPTPARTIVLAGFKHQHWNRFPGREARALDRAIREGCRVIIALPEMHHAGEPLDAEEKPDEAKAEKDGKDAGKKRAARTDEQEPPVNLAAWWDVQPEIRWLIHDARREEEAPLDLPEELRTSSDVYFKFPLESPWRLIYRRGTGAVLIERRFGRGTLVLAGDAYFLSNEAMQQARAPALIAWAIGPHRTVEFNEGHLGVIENRGVAALARSYGLTGAFFALVVAAALFVWHRMALLVAPAAETAEVSLAYNQTAGLEALLRRAVGEKELPAACVAEWRRTARPVDIARVEAALAASAPNAPAATTYNAIMRVLRRRAAR